MIGLIIKDLYNLKKIKSTYFILTTALVLYCLLRNLYSLVGIIPVLVFSTTITSTFSMDESVKWNKLAIPATLRRKDIVKSKYVLQLLIICIGVFAGTILSLPGLLCGRVSTEAWLRMMLFSIEIALCSGSLSIGFVYLSENPIDKMELLTVFSYIISIAIVMTIGKILNMMNITNTKKWRVTLINLLLIAFIYIVSYMISMRAFTKRDVH